MQEVINKATDEFGEHAKKVMADFKETEFMTADGNIKNQPKIKVILFPEIFLNPKFRKKNGSKERKMKN